MKVWKSKSSQIKHSCSVMSERIFRMAACRFRQSIHSMSQVRQSQRCCICNSSKIAQTSKKSSLRSKALLKTHWWWRRPCIRWHLMMKWTEWSRWTCPPESRRIRISYWKSSRQFTNCQKIARETWRQVTICIASNLHYPNTYHQASTSRTQTSKICRRPKSSTSSRRTSCARLGADSCHTNKSSPYERSKTWWFRTK